MAESTLARSATNPSAWSAHFSEARISTGDRDEGDHDARIAIMIRIARNAKART